MKPESFTLILNSLDGVSNLGTATANFDKTFTVNPYSFLGGSVNEIKPQLYKIDVKLLTGFNIGATVPSANLFHVIINTGSKINQMVGTNSTAGIYVPLFKGTSSNVDGGNSTSNFKGEITISGFIPSNQIRVKFFFSSGNIPFTNNNFSPYLLTMTYTPIFDDSDLI